MHYSNDEVDKSIRKRNFYLGAYALPLGAGAGLAALAFFPVQNRQAAGQ